MADAICNTSPLLYLHRIEAILWLPKLFGEIWTPDTVKRELQQGQQRGYDVPNPVDHHWLKIVNPRSVPSEWLTLDLGMGELETMALALDNSQRIVLLDDGLARRIAEAAGLKVWGTLRVLLEAKSQGWIERVEPYIDRLVATGMWISNDLRQQVLTLAGETNR